MKIIYEDRDLLVINKPPGLVVDRDKGLPGLEDYFIVHRLDKDTSGLLIVAKTPEALEGLQHQFKERKVRKGYLALVHGRVQPPQGVINKSIGRNPKDSKKFAVVEDGKEAVTRYRVAGLPPASGLQRSGSPSPGYSLLEVEPLTGRTHQIRVHLRSIGHPVVGDRLYASRRQLRGDDKFCARQFLHAYRLGFEHPGTGEWLTFEVELAEDLKKVLDAIIQ